VKKYTTDTFFNGQIQVKQDSIGYRFSIDAVLLAYFTKPRPSEKILDLGTGCGIIPLIMGYRNPELIIHAIEVQPDLAELAALNIKDNHMQGRILIRHQDMKTLKPDDIGGPVDLIVCNPPYRKPNSGRINPVRQRALARHEIKATLFDVIRTAQRLLRTGGRFVTIYTADRLADLIAHMRSDQIEPKMMRIIHSTWNTEAKLILVEGIKGGRPGIKIASPLIIYDEHGNYTDAVNLMFQP